MVSYQRIEYDAGAYHYSSNFIAPDSGIQFKTTGQTDRQVQALKNFAKANKNAMAE